MARILIVDDDPDFAEITRILLQAEGYEVITASNRKQAFERMGAQPPDLVLLDIMLAYVFDGISIAKEMKMNPNLRHIPILVVSSLSDAQSGSIYPGTDAAEFIDGWIAKPVKPEELTRRVADILSQRSGK